MTFEEELLNAFRKTLETGETTKVKVPAYVRSVEVTVRKNKLYIGYYKRPNLNLIQVEVGDIPPHIDFVYVDVLTRSSYTNMFIHDGLVSASAVGEHVKEVEFSIPDRLTIQVIMR